MYKDYRDNSKPDIVIDIDNYECTCSGCPTIYEFTDKGRGNYSFYLRHGKAQLRYEGTNSNPKNELLLSAHMDDFDGICGWSDVVEWAKSNKIQISG